jgi:DNA polymerase
VSLDPKLAPQDDVALEFETLVNAARAHLRRRRAFGDRRTRLPLLERPAPARPSAAELAPAPPAARAEAPAARTNVPPPPPPTLRPLPTPAATPPAPAPPPPPPLKPSAPTAPSPASEVAARAAACKDLASLRAAVAECRACGLCSTRTQTVFSDGPDKVRLLFVGEAPGEQEDLTGVPFVGAAGQLLTDIIEKGIGIPRSQVAIANVLKCRPPGNRDPSQDEKRACAPWLARQIELLGPEVIVPLGRHAANHLLGVEGPDLRSMGSLRGQVLESRHGKLVPTYHPSYLLRTPDAKKDCWKDIQVAMGLLGLDPPKKRA